MYQRVIGLLPKLVRDWSKVRRAELTPPRIEANAKERPWIWGGSAGKAAPSAAAHSAFEAEAANAGGQAFAEGIIDLKQAYERVDHASLAASLFSPLHPTVADLLLQQYHAHRSLAVGGATSDWAVPLSGIVAGCPLADSPAGGP